MGLTTISLLFKVIALGTVVMTFHSEEDVHAKEVVVVNW